MDTQPLPAPPVELLAQAPVALTVLDREARVLYYNPYAATILDRKPSYIGRDVRELHNPASNERIDAILAAYASGERGEFSWVLERGDKRFAVRVAPWMKDGEWAGVLHAVVVLQGLNHA
ncbi:MAG: PAS domain-containing protein [Desulfarculaceae bacterium]|nr:PAS domain-containing protein [Desulfarculaceae bacterium]